MMRPTRVLAVAAALLTLPMPAGRVEAGLVGRAVREVAEQVATRGRGAAAGRLGPGIIVRSADPEATALARLPRRSPGLLHHPAAPLSPRDTRRRAVLDTEGAMARTGRREEQLAVIGRHGDQAMGFVWRHKGALAVSAVLGSFLAQPEAFLGGSRRLAEEVAAGVGGPAGRAVESAATRWVRLAWPLLFVPAAAGILVLVPRLARRVRRHRDD